MIMNRIVFVLLLSVVYVKLINGQLLNACEQAQQSLASNETCVNASIDGIENADANIVCSETCRDLYNGVMNVCPGTTYLRNLIYALCDPCGIPLTAVLSGDPSCSSFINVGRNFNLTAICTGRCRSLMDDIIANCPNTTSDRYSDTINLRCTPCGMAQTTLGAHRNCSLAFNSRWPDACTPTCRPLGDAVVENCNTSRSSSYANTINSLCGGTNTGNCETAYSAVDASCIDLLNNNNLSCTSTCGTQLSAAVAACGSSTDPQIRGVVSAYNTLCSGSEVQCNAALQALEDTASCQSMDSSVICSGTCRNLYFAVINACPDTSATYSDTLDMHCTPCGMAQTNLDLNFNCYVAFTSDDADPDVCTPTCRTLGDAIIENCNASISSTYADAIDSLCGGTNTGNCETAYSAVDASCIDLLNNNGLSCTSTCGTQLSAAVTACGSSTNPQIQGAVSAYNRLCGPDAQCNATLQALEERTSCQSMDSSIVCAGACKNLYFAAIDACPDAQADIVRRDYNLVCGSGSGSGSMLKASGIITLLLLAVRALICM